MRNKLKLCISWDELSQTCWEHMKCSYEEGYKPDLITELVSWLDSVIWEYSEDYDVVVEGCDFRLWKLNSYEDIIDFVEAYEEELRHDEEIFYEEIIK
jgi:hypothetical protein